MASGFLGAATLEQLLQAIASNHRAWFTRNARVAGGEAWHGHGMTVIHTPGYGGTTTILFPRLRVRTAGEQLDAVVRRCHAIDGLREVGVWSLSERTSPPDLGIRLVARGFEHGWRPHWMWLDLHNLSAGDPGHLRIELVQGAEAWDVDDLPYYDAETARQLRALSHARPRRVWHFAAWSGERPVGQCVLNVTTGRLGVAGIYNVGVVPESRRRGVGKAVMIAALQFARNLGCRHAILNATEMGEPLYHSLGFTTLGYGQTWWMRRDVLEREPPGLDEVAFAEAVGRGDVATLDTLASELLPLDATLRCGLTAVQLAVQSEQPQVVAWLVEHGATLDIVSAWDLGWKDQAICLLAASPQLANRAPGKQQRTPLHEAALRDDSELARIVLAANPDLDIVDPMFQSTALGWARHFGRDEIIRMIEQQKLPDPTV